jgi:hypothetical protein
MRSKQLTETREDLPPIVIVQEVIRGKVSSIQILETVEMRALLPLRGFQGNVKVLLPLRGSRCNVIKTTLWILNTNQSLNQVDVGILPLGAIKYHLTTTATLITMSSSYDDDSDDERTPLEEFIQI